jgi:hypothetical protein
MRVRHKHVGRSSQVDDDKRLMVVGTLVTGFYAIEAGIDERLSPVFDERENALIWLANQTRDRDRGKDAHDQDHHEHLDQRWRR